MGIKSVSGRWVKVELLGLGALMLAACATGIDPLRPSGGGGAGGDPSGSTSGVVDGPSTSNTTGDFTTSTSVTTSSASSSSAASSSAASSSAASSSAASSSAASSSAASSSASSSTGGVVMGLVLQYFAADVNPTDNQMKPHFRILNGSSSSVPLSSLTIRYYFTAEGNPPQIFECDYATVGCGNLTGVYAPTTGASADHYLEVSFTAGAGSISAGGNSGEIQARLHNQDYSNVNEANDYSFDPTKTAFADWTKVTLYQSGALVWGTEP
jgi:Cellulose binding domain